MLDITMEGRAGAPGRASPTPGMETTVTTVTTASVFLSPSVKPRTGRTAMTETTAAGAVGAVAAAPPAD